jgi:hypothetical protein
MRHRTIVAFFGLMVVAGSVPAQHHAEDEQAIRN